MDKLTYVIPQPDEQAGDAQGPEDEPEGLGHAQLRGRGLALEVERQDDGDCDNSHVDGEAQVAQEGALVGAVVAGVRGLVLEQQGAEEGPREEGGAPA